MRTLLLLLSAGLLTTAVSRAQFNAALNKTATASGPLWSGFPVSNITDGNPATFTHPLASSGTLGFKYEINLGRAWALDRIRLFNRDNCCPERLSNYRVSVHPDNGAGAPGAAVWTANVRTNGTNSGMGGVDELTAAAHPAGIFTGQWLRIENLSNSAYNPQIAEVQALSYDIPASPNIALYKPITSSAATWAGNPVTNVNDGSLASMTHPVATAGTSLGFYYQIDFQNDYPLDRAVIYGRTDGCCPERLTKYRMQLFADNGGVPGAVTWSADMRTDGTYPNSGEADTVRAENGTGSFHGRFLRVTNLSNEAYNPQIAEIEAYRPPAPVIKFFTTDTGNITATGAPGMAAQATLSWDVTGASTLTLDQGIGPVTAPSGTQIVTPAAQTTYTLTATNSSGTSTASVTIAIDAAQLAPRINEIMAENDGSLDDEDGSQPDWIELFNPNAFTIGLAGAHLSDDPALPAKWAFPAGSSIPPGGFLVVFASGKDRAVTGSPLHTNFELRKAGETVALYAPGGALWSRIPADYPVSLTYPAQVRDTGYGIDGAGDWRYFRPSTPNAANAAVGFVTVVEDTQFAVKRGIYDTPQSVAITSATPGATIRYTTNGTKPTESTGTAYSGPISVSTTTVIRAAAFMAGAAPSNVDTHTYLFPATVAGQSVMQAAVTGNAVWGPQIPQALRDVPSVSLTTPNSAAFNNDTEIETNFEFLHPADPLQHAHANSGTTYFGGAFTNFTKKSFRLYFKGAYGDKKLVAPLFAGHEHGYHAVQEFDGLELRSGSHDMNQRGFYMSNLFADQVLMEQGQLAPHGRFVHVYLNGTYWGLYHMRERWNASMHAGYLGGQKEDYEAINGNYNVGGWAVPGQPFDGDGTAWEYAKSRRTSYAELRGLIDVPNYTDYMITWMFGNSEDEWRGVSPARLVGPGSGSRFILNDADGWLSVNGSNALAVWDGNDNNTGRASTWNGTTFTAGRTAGDGPGSLLAAMYLTAGSDYRTLLADRIHHSLFNDGPLTPARNQARLDAMCQAIQRAFIAEAARWNFRLPADPPGGAENSGDWEDAWTVCRNNWMPGRTAAALTQFRNAGLYPTLNAPVFSPNGGTFTAPLALSITAPAGASIYYTLDGSDPRLPGGAVAGGALLYSAPVSLTANTLVRARSFTAPSTWSALQERFFRESLTAPVPAGAVIPVELHFNPTGDDDTEFVELMNVSAQAVNLRGCRFTAGIDFAFSEFRDTVLAPGQRLVLVDSEFAHRARYGWDRTIGGIYFDNLNNAGETISFVCGTDNVFSFAFNDDTHPLADSGGHSLTLILPRPGIDLSDPANWRASQPLNGSPGSGDTGVRFTGDPGADIDGDGAGALLEYALASSDSAADSVPELGFDPGAAAGFSYIRTAAPDDAIIIPEISTDLENWLSGGANIRVVSEEIQRNGTIRVHLEPQPGAIGDAVKFYARVRVVPRL